MRALLIVDDFSPGLVCGCGASSFERVVVRRPGRIAITTVFVECVECHAAYVSAPDWQMLDEGEHLALVVEVRDAAKDYRKPGREPRIGDKRRRR